MLSLFLHWIKTSNGRVSIKSHCYLMYLITNLCTITCVSWLITLSRSHKELEEFNEVLHSVLKWNSLYSAEVEPRGPGCWLCFGVFCFGRLFCFLRSWAGRSFQAIRNLFVTLLFSWAEASSKSFLIFKDQASALKIPPKLHNCMFCHNSVFSHRKQNITLSFLRHP